MATSRRRAPTLAAPPAATAAALAFSALLAADCSDTFRSTPHAEQMLDGVAARFAPNVFDARYNTARVKLAQSALVPSRIFDDTTVWESRATPAARAMFVAGAIGADGRYHLDARPSLTPAARAGDSRHSIVLEQLASNQFRWDTHVDLSIGATSADEVAAVFTDLLRAPEGRTERELRDDYRAAFPRATAAFGRGFVLDSLIVAPAALGTTSVMLRFVYHPELMKPSLPKLADYLDKYLGPAKYHFALFDRNGGAALFDVAGRDRAMTIRYRLQGGRLVSLLGPPRPWSDSLMLLADVSVKVKMFTVGFHDLATDFAISNTSSGNIHDRAWTVVAQKEPKWELPLITERLIRSPLRRPFEGQGVLFRLSVRDSAGGQTMFGRHTRLDVQESAIMRFIGSLGSRAVGDLDGGVEDEEHRFLREGLTALAADLRR